MIPPALCLWVYWLGLWCWFHDDDFSLLFLVRLPPEEFWPSMLQPRGPGHFRPLSERLFFYLFHGWFGFDGFPFRVMAFGTHFVNLILLGLLTKRLTGRLLLGVVAASLWGVHHGLAPRRTRRWTLPDRARDAACSPAGWKADAGPASGRGTRS